MTWAEYEARLRKTSQDTLARHNNGLSFEEWSAREEEVEPYYLDNMLARIGYHLNEARAMIEALERKPDAPDDHAHQLVWVGQGSAEMPFGGDLRQVKRTREEMLARLRWIANDDFGPDTPPWSDWLDTIESE